MSTKGQVYLICFNEHYHHAKHYIGFAKSGVEARLERHRSGHGSKLLRAVTQANIGFDVARVWDNVDRNFERKLKNHKKSQDYCPRCGGKK